MYTGLQHAHSYIAYLALILLIVASINAIIGMSSNKEFKDGDRKLSLFALIFTHTIVNWNYSLFCISNGTVFFCSYERQCITTLCIRTSFDKHYRGCIDYNWMV